MSNEKFTKGPWQYTPAGPADSQGMGICAMWGEGSELTANAHLIVAAPKMYDILKTLSSIMPMLDEQTHPSIEMDALKHDIDALLAEARGELNE